MRVSRNDTIKISVMIMAAWWCALMMSLWSGDGKIRTHSSNRGVTECI